MTIALLMHHLIKSSLDCIPFSPCLVINSSVLPGSLQEGVVQAGNPLEARAGNPLEVQAEILLEVQVENPLEVRAGILPVGMVLLGGRRLHGVLEGS